MQVDVWFYVVFSARLISIGKMVVLTNTGDFWLERRKVDHLFGRFLLLLALVFGQENGVDVGENTTRSDGHTLHHFVQFFVISDSELDVARDNSSSLVVFGSVSSQLQDLSAQVLEHSGQVDGSSATNTLGVTALTQEAGDSAHREGQTSTGRPRG